MEKTKGVALGNMWPKMDIEQRWAVIQAIARHQKAWTSVSFDQFGSLFYAKDLDEHMQSLSYVKSEGVRTSNTKFCVGPTTARDSVDDGRMAVSFDKGPCNQMP